jgi:predicted RNA binding protein YcfA (HicA-like mRNA interferase family)
VADDLLEKLGRFSIKKKELETLLSRLGFSLKPGKGSHAKWIKPGLPPIVIATHDKDLKDYQIRQVINVLKMGGMYEEGEKGKKRD